MERRGGRGAGIHPWPSGPGESKNLHFNKNPGDALVAGPGMGTGDPQCPVVARKHMNRGGLIQYRLISHCCTLRAGREGLPGRSISTWIKAALLTPAGAQGAPRGRGLKDQAWGRGPFPPTSRGREAGGLTGPQMLSGHSHGFGEVRRHCQGWALPPPKSSLKAKSHCGNAAWDRGSSEEVLSITLNP